MFELLSFVSMHFKFINILLLFLGLMVLAILSTVCSMSRNTRTKFDLTRFALYLFCIKNYEHRLLQ
jgi:hypothetical protein